MTLQEFIDKRQSLSFIQRYSLVQLLSAGCRREVKTQVRNIIDFRFYSTFDGLSTSKRIIIHPDYVEYKPRTEETYREELKELRVTLLGRA